MPVPTFMCYWNKTDIEVKQTCLCHGRLCFCVSATLEDFQPLCCMTSLLHGACGSLAVSSHVLRRNSSSASSNAWLSRQSRDPFVKQRNEDSFRARSAYKLREIDQKYRFLQKAQVVVDLGAAPGGWSEYVSHTWRDRSTAHLHSPKDSTIATVTGERAFQKPIILAVDLLPIEPIQGVVTVKGNFLSKEIYDRLQRHFRGRQVDVVLSDMCENTSGNRDRDIASALELCNAALIFAQREFAKCVPHGPRRGPRKTFV
jgi:23S rRNA (uridine2552-2'-O)-methyltransferase